MMARMKQGETPSTPRVGIIFFFDQKLWIESTSLETAGNYGQFKIHEGDHVFFWNRLIKEGLVPPYEKYENIPRGRVVFNISTMRFRLMLDRCILRQKSLVAKIEHQMGLPRKETDTDTDSHYRCGGCLVFDGRDQTS
jgi:hypothetical protein